MQETDWIASGTCHTIFAYDVGVRVKLADAAGFARALAGIEVVPARRTAPRYLNVRENPLRLTGLREPLPIGSFTTDPEVEIIVFPFGAVSVAYRIRVSPIFS